ncbi:hypothetical protein [Comamonas sp.]|uniref:hypothetical protein n=1 Tax=Comamonas sp. TaxID=34028 RepID=UPI0025BEE27F|nr:hypothetical protein [Comamonas sp.]
MKFEDFLSAGYHFSNFQPEQLETMFNVAAIEELPKHKTYEQAALMLSQILVGNRQDPINTVKELPEDERKRVLETWVDVLNNADDLKSVAYTIIHC